eukprot:TRINITY_DN1121_c0_g2_i1.p1 TRINITY_DN1121_c0_g2~~TRINITY_DN1121_c0_g2_i1.p1  ORF type:complete len:764 (-),score=147.66 TRINITY_DN1121_c0_g2_i1:176-2467(-)
MMGYDHQMHQEDFDLNHHHPHIGQNDFLLKQTPLSHLAPEFGTIEYLLQLSLQSPSATVTHVWSLASPHVTIQFERRVTGLLVLDSWVEAARLHDHNSVADLAQRGFKFPPQGMVFPTGSILLKSLQKGGLRGKRTYEFVLCKIGVGRSYCIEDSAPTTKPFIPEGYDSLYLHKSEEILEREYPELKNSKYYHEYVLVDPAQVLPAFLVQFQYDPDEDESRKIPICESCETRPATRFCRSDNARLCDYCDETVHSANKLVSRHVRVPIYEQPQGFGNCAQHLTQTVEFFCPHCQIAVCVHCKMVGSHSAGEAASHKLIPINDAYRQAVGAAERDDPLMDGRKQGILTQLSLLDQRLKEINQNSQEIEERIYAMLRDALFQLQQETQKKLAVLLGEELELRRQLEQMDWLEGFLRLNRQMLPPTQFLSSWNRHSQLRSDMHGFAHARAQLDVYPDIRLRATIEVTTEENLRREENDDWGDENSMIPSEEQRGRSPNLSQSLNPIPPTPPVDIQQSLPPQTNNSQSSFSVRKTTDIWSDELRKRHLGGVMSVSQQDNREKERGGERNEHSMIEEAERRTAVLAEKGFEVHSISPFSSSRILNPTQSTILYFCLPFNSLPTTRLMFSTHTDGTSVAALHRACDAIGPTLIVARVGDQIFGGYASTSWNTTQLPFGTSKSFLFSLTKDTKVPYTGARDTCCLYGSPTSLCFGHVDLVFKDDLRNCSSDLENSYGIGLPHQSIESRSFLAGDQRFEVTALEVWAFVQK